MTINGLFGRKCARFAFYSGCPQPGDSPLLYTERPVLGISDFGVAEFASAVGRRVRMGEFTAAEAVHALNGSDSWFGYSAERLDLEPSDIRVASIFLRRFALGLRAPDAMHLAICQRLGLVLFTFDRGQAAAAEELGIQSAYSP